MTDKSNPWTTLSAETRFENDWFTVVENEVIDPSGNRTTYGTVRFKVHGVAVLPIDAEGRTRLVGQFRYALNAYQWELPKGSGNPDEDPQEAARRELREEAGLTARRWLPLGRVNNTASITDDRVTCFLVWDLEPRPADPDEQEELSLRRIPFAEAVAMAARGEIADAVSALMLLKVERMARQGELPPDVAALLGGP